MAIPSEGVILLPTTLDEAHKSVFQPKSKDTSKFRREFAYEGDAIYSKEIEIPSEWGDKLIYLVLERTKPASVFVDGNYVACNSVISSSHRYDLSKKLLPGKHLLEIKVNNSDSIPPLVRESSNATSDASQTNWNGILGNISLIAKPTFHISEIKINDAAAPDSIKINVVFNSPSPEDFLLKLDLNENFVTESQIKKNEELVELVFPIPGNQLWSASNPLLHDLNFRIINSDGKEIDNFSTTTGFRNFSTLGNKFTINSNPIFLRGTVNAAVFPLTGYAPMNEEFWERYFKTLKSYGLNHVRFHSWTPPEAAFNAADKVGMYVLTELPIWGDFDRNLNFQNKFLHEELKGIMKDYGRHPSLVMFSPGNELWGDISLMKEYKDESKKLNPRLLSTYATNLYSGIKGEIGDEDFIISEKTSDDTGSALRGSMSFADSKSGGIINSTIPNSEFNYSEAAKNIKVPVISHETGQYQSYPGEIPLADFTGMLKPDNYEIFKQRAVENGLSEKSSMFAEASGKWASKLYRAEIEAALRTPEMGGVELFGIQDFPGQGGAFVGLLDVFLNEKSHLSKDEWNNSFSDITVIAEWPRFTFLSGEKVSLPVKVYNYSGNPLTESSFNWVTPFSSGNLNGANGFGELDLGVVELDMPILEKPEHFVLELNSDDGLTANNYDFWVYPEKSKDVKNIDITDNIEEAISLLEKGRKVLLCPDSASVAYTTLPPLFTTDFWSFEMYRTLCKKLNLEPSPGTFGLLINEEHPALSEFPTSTHTDWQWYPIVNNSRPLIIDRLPPVINPIIEVIDNPQRSLPLALMLEFNLAKGKLVILMVDKNKTEESIEGKWLIQSVKEYMGSKNFRPEFTLSPEQLENLLTRPSDTRKIESIRQEYSQPEV